MTNTRSIERIRVPAVRRRWLRGPTAKAVCIAAIALPCMALGVNQVVDLLRWRDAGAAARSVAGRRSAPLQHRIDGMTVAWADARETIVLLQAIAAEDGPQAVHARNFLARLAAQQAPRQK